MSNPSPNLSLPFLMPSQAQKHVTHNEALGRIDAVVQLSLQAVDATQPPGQPLDGQLWAVGSGATGAWAGQDGLLAWFTLSGWRFVVPQTGWRAWDLSDDMLRVFDGNTWQAAFGALNNLDGVGIGTSFDATNKLSVAAPATLLSHGGTDHRVTINKAGAGDTASVLFQSNWSGRAEFGLTGDDDFHVRVSADGSSFTDAFKLRRTDGVMEATCLMSGTVEIANNAVATLPTPGTGGMAAINLVDPALAQTDHCGLLAYGTGSVLSLAALSAGSAFDNLGTTALTGTTGTSGHLSVAVESGALKIENREGAQRRIAFTFLNTF